MATITDPVVVAFTGKLRQSADILVGLKAGLDYLKTDYLGGVTAAMSAITPVPVDADVIDDGQPVTSGRPALDKGEFDDLVGAVNGVLAAIDAVNATLVKASVNPRAFILD